MSDESDVDGDASLAPAAVRLTSALAYFIRQLERSRGMERRPRVFLRSVPTLLSLVLLAAPPATLFNGVAMKPVAPDVYAEEPVTRADRTAIARAVTSAYRELRSVFGNDTRFEAIVFVCRTPGCKVAFGAPAQAARSPNLGFAAVSVPGVPADRAVVVTGPNGHTARVATHELVHALMKTWAPYDALPTWLNEGLATAIADEPPCDQYAPTSELDVTALVTKAQWQALLAETGEVHRTYCQARYAAEAWAGFGGKRELATRARAFARAVARGE